MNKKIIIMDIILAIIVTMIIAYLAFGAEVEVNGAHTFKNCMHQCMKENGIENFEDYYKDQDCSECFDDCTKQLLAKEKGEDAQTIYDSIVRQLKGEPEPNCFIGNL